LILPTSITANGKAKPAKKRVVRGGETIDVPTRGPLTFTDPKSMLAECIAGTGVAQIIGWGVGALLAEESLIDLFPKWHGERFPLFAFHPSRKHPPAKVRAFVDFVVEVRCPGCQARAWRSKL
jgi:DNA-binding transcriptional LysR family regulator